MLVDIKNEYKFNFENGINLTELYDDLLLKGTLYKKFIDRLEDYESTYVEFNMIEIIKVILNKDDNSLSVEIKVHNLMSLNSSFYYKKIVIK